MFALRNPKWIIISLSAERIDKESNHSQYSLERGWAKHSLHTIIITIRTWAIVQTIHFLVVIFQGKNLYNPVAAE